MSEISIPHELIFESGSSAAEGLTLRSLKGREALSELYEYELLLEAPGDVELDDATLFDLMRQPVTVRFGEGGQQRVHGLLRAIAMGSYAAGEALRYRATLAPRWWAASQTVRSRVFRDFDATGLARRLLSELGLREGEDFTLALHQSYPSSEHTVQYEESDLAFLSRVLEHFGIFYFFAQEEDRERLILADSNKALEPFDANEQIPYVTDAGRAEDGRAGVHELHRELEARPAAVYLRDYNWRSPEVLLAAEARADEAIGRGYHLYYGEHFKDNAAGAALARVRAEALLADRDRYRGSCSAAALRPGHTFELCEHPLGSLNRRYGVTAIEQEAAGEDGAVLYQKRFTAIPYELPFRPARRTPKPRVYGVMHAHIEGAVEGAAAPIDQHGSYLVTFPFDSGRGQRADEPGSRRIRMAQPSSGAGYGTHLPLHVGAEVAIGHIDGDPDRPIILGSTPNASTVSPVREGNAQQSQIRTKSGITMIFDDEP